MTPVADVEASVVQVHEREERAGLGRVADRMLGEVTCQPDGVVAQLAADRVLGVGRQMALG